MLPIEKTVLCLISARYMKLRQIEQLRPCFLTNFLLKNCACNMLIYNIDTMFPCFLSLMVRKQETSQEACLKSDKKDN